MTDTRHYTLVQTHVRHNTTSEPSRKPGRYEAPISGTAVAHALPQGDLEEAAWQWGQGVPAMSLRLALSFAVNLKWF